MTPEEVRLRCIEAAAKLPLPHPDGYAVGTLAAAQAFEAYVLHHNATLAGGDLPGPALTGTLGVPRKKG